MVLQMVEVFEWCLELGVQHISVYAFSIDNFKRTCGEVEGLMHLAEKKYMELLQVGADLHYARHVSRAPAGMPCRCHQCCAVAPGHPCFCISPICNKWTFLS